MLSAFDEFSISNENFAELCRFCAIKNGSPKIDMFDENDANILFKIRSVLPLSVRHFFILRTLKRG